MGIGAHYRFVGNYKSKVAKKVFEFILDNDWSESSNNMSEFEYLKYKQIADTSINGVSTWFDEQRNLSDNLNLSKSVTLSNQELKIKRFD